MQPIPAKRAVLLAMLGTGTVAVIKAARAGTVPRVGIGIGTVLGAAGLAALADPAPDLAAGLASLTLLTSLLASPEAITAGAAALNSSHQANTGSLRAKGAAGGTIAGLAASVGFGTSAAEQLAGADSAAALRPGEPGTITVGNGSSTPYTGYASNVPVDRYDTAGHPVPQLQSVGGRFQLAPVAAQAFARWEAGFGAPIVLTGAYRPIPASGVSNGKDGSAPTKLVHYVGHYSGEAVDVNLGLTGCDPYKATSDPRRVKWERLVSSARAAGWANWTDSKNYSEAWHWSYNGRH